MIRTAAVKNTGGLARGVGWRLLAALVLVAGVMVGGCHETPAAGGMDAGAADALPAHIAECGALPDADAVGDAGTASDAGAASDGGGGGSSDGSAGGIAGCSAVDLPPDSNLDGIWVGLAGEVWVAGQGGFVGRRAPDASGGGWIWCRPGAAVNLHAIWGSASDDVWAVGDGGTILRWDGGRWVTIAAEATGAPAPGNLWDVWGRTVTGGYGPEVWVVGDGGVVRRFDGHAWHVEDAPRLENADEGPYMLRGVWGSPARVIRVVGFAQLPELVGINGEEAVVLRQEASGAWTREGVFPQERGGATFSKISGTSEDNIWTAGTWFPSGAATGFALAAHFDGTAWTAAAGGPGLGGAPEEVIVDRFYWDVVAGPPDAPGGAWFASGFPTAVRFDGATWTASDSVTTWLRAIDARGAEMWAAGHGGKVIRWTTAGWVVDHAQDPPPPL